MTYRYEPVAADLVDVARILAETGVFTEREIAVAQELIDDRITHGAASEYRFIFAEADGGLAGYVCYGPITITEDRYDLYWIATDPSHARQGIGRGLMAEAERIMADEGCAIVYVETSSRDVYGKSRLFYEACGYEVSATVRDYFSDGDSKVIYSKRLQRTK